VARWTGTWLSGLGAAGVELRSEGDWRGKRLGLPASGAGSVASFNARLGGIVVDIVGATLIGGLANAFVRSPDFATKQGAGIAALLAMYALLLPTAGQTFGMRLARIRVARLDARPLAFLPALLRGALVVLTVPALITDRDGRGLHDKAVRSVVVRT
jgi:uncharacterized RDD family membrane protein YckC